MLMANSFELWQRDYFFSAAEEVQRSADIMDSAYRTWLRARRDGKIHQNLDELGRELQRTLGTAKWQLEEFERAVHSNYRKHGDDISITRHRQFVSALEEQISVVEVALKEAINLEEKKPFRWVNLDEEECENLAVFLSGTPGPSPSIKDESENIEAMLSSPYGKKTDLKEDNHLCLETIQGKHLEVVANNEASGCIMELEGRNFSEKGSEMLCQADGTINNDRTWRLPNKNALEIIIDCDAKQINLPIEATPKEKGFRPLFWRLRCEEGPGATGVFSTTWLNIITWMKHHLRGGHRSQRQHQMPPMSPVNSIRFILCIMLAIVLLVPFLLYST